MGYDKIHPAPVHAAVRFAGVLDGQLAGLLVEQEVRPLAEYGLVGPPLGGRHVPAAGVRAGRGGGRERAHKKTRLEILNHKSERPIWGLFESGDWPNLSDLYDSMSLIPESVDRIRCESIQFGGIFLSMIFFNVGDLTDWIDKHFIFILLCWDFLTNAVKNLNLKNKNKTKFCKIICLNCE